ncbi:MAG: hypothetical protein WC341_13850 [Bacteroidales bacterium]|jgi:hypothetical protein
MVIRCPWEQTIILPEYDGQGEVRCKVSLGSQDLQIQPEGTGTFEGDFAPIVLEFYEGKVRLLVWSDINAQDPTHVIELPGALETARKKVKDDYENGVCPDCGEPIPDDAYYGGSCTNCNHVWNPVN